MTQSADPNSGPGPQQDDVPNGTSNEPLISDEDWIELKTLSGLLDIARPEIEAVIYFYRNYKSKGESLRAPAALRDLIARWRGSVEKTRERTLELGRDPEISAALVMGREDSFSKSTKENVDKLIAETIARLEDLSELLGIALAAAPSGKDGPDNKILYIAINALNGFLWIHTGKVLNQGKVNEGTGNFGLKVFQIADPYMEPSEPLDMIRNHQIPVEDGPCLESIVAFMNAVSSVRAR